MHEWTVAATNALQSVSSLSLSLSLSLPFCSQLSGVMKTQTILQYNKSFESQNIQSNNQT